MSFWDIVKFLQNSSPLVVGVLFSGAMARPYFAEVFRLRSHQRELQLINKDGDEVPLDDQTKILGDEILLSLPLKTSLLSKMKIFFTHRLDPVHLGSFHTRPGSVIGIPYYARYKRVEDIQNGEFTKLQNIQIDFESEVGVKLANSLLLSDNAVKFILARECHYADSYTLFVKSLILLAYFFPAYYIVHSAIRVLRLPQRTKVWFRFLLYGIYWGAALFWYFRLLDKYDRYCDNYVDKKTAEMSKDIAEGGIEYYDKTLQRNRILRDILGEEGKLKFTKYGNELNTIFRPLPHVPLTSRKQLLEQFINEHDYNNVVQKTDENQTE